MTDTLTAVFLGHVDHGKSTLVARLLLDSGAFPEGRLRELEAACQRRGVPLEISFLLDAFQIERDQAITIDATRIWLNTPNRALVFIDAPGHKEFVKHMVSGAWEANAAVLLVDAIEGVSEQTRRHLLLLSLLNVRQIVLVVNKMDAVKFDQARFNNIENEIKALLSRWDLSLWAAVPTSAKDGDNVVRSSERMPWYKGPSLLTVFEQLETTPIQVAPLRFGIQDVYRKQEQRIFVGTLHGGPLHAGMQLQFLPNGQHATVQKIVRFPEDEREAHDGESIGIALDKPLFLQPGDVASKAAHAPHVATEIDATVFWLSSHPLQLGGQISVRLGERDSIATVTMIHEKIDMDTLAYHASVELQNNDIANIRLRFELPMVVDVRRDSGFSRFAMYDEHLVRGGGIITSIVTDLRSSQRSANVSPERGLVTLEQRFRRYGHTSGVVWLTGLPGSGKSTLAKQVEALLFARGWHIFVLDGDTLRVGLNGDLGFSVDDRAENVRRVGEVAALFARAGMICITALVSPFEQDRECARQACVAGNFKEVFIKTPLEVCEQRDPKGLYRRARLGEIESFTGISSPYEPPAQPQLVIDTSTEDIEESVETLYSYIVATFRAD